MHYTTGNNLNQPVSTLPIRHHSPRIQHAFLIEQIKPDYVLIEGPDSFNELLTSLLHHDTQPPVAIMANRIKTDTDR